MKFFVDARLPRRLAYQFRTVGHETVHALDLSKGNRIPDTALGEPSIRDRVVVVPIPSVS